MENRIISYCGITCSECDAYLATQTKDTTELERVAAAWSEAYKTDITAAAIMCDGCLATEEPHSSYCLECGIRACAIDRGVASCAYCEDYGCDTLEGFVSQVSGLRQALESIRAAHLGTAAD
jgi:hypothetical protein